MPQVISITFIFVENEFINVFVISVDFSLILGQSGKCQNIADYFRQCQNIYLFLSQPELSSARIRC